MTIHTTFNFNSNALIQPKRKKPIQRVTSPIKGADVVIIDEISMCRLDVFEAVVASIMKAETVSGIHKQIVVMGDFYQLPPVIDGGQFDRQILTDYYDAGKQDGTKAGFIVGTIGVLVALAFKENDIAAKMYGAAPGSTIPSLDAELGYRECRE